MIIYDGTGPINISINIDCSRNLFSQTSILIDVFYKHCVFLSVLLALNVCKRIRTNDEIKKRSQKPKTEYKFPGPLHNLCGSIIIHDVSLQSWLGYWFAGQTKNLISFQNISRCRSNTSAQYLIDIEIYFKILKTKYYWQIIVNFSILPSDFTVTF